MHKYPSAQKQDCIIMRGIVKEAFSIYFFFAADFFFAFVGMQLERSLNSIFKFVKSYPVYFHFYRQIFLINRTNPGAA